MIDSRLSEEIEVGAKAIPMFSTEIVTTDGGWEVRNSRWAYPRYRFEFNLMPDQTSFAVIDEFMRLYIAAGGAAETFLFTPWHDYQGSGEAAEEITGTTFQLFKNYTRGGVTRKRKITRPQEDTVTIYVDGVEQLSGVTINYDTGVVTFDSTKTGLPVTADFSFDVLVRFMDDELEVLAHTGELLQPVSVTLLQVKE